MPYPNEHSARLRNPDDTAKSWLKKNKVKYQSFEPAKPKDKQSLSDNTAPAAACVFSDMTIIEAGFSEGEGKKESNRFRIVGYSGGIIKNILPFTATSCSQR